MDSVVVKVHPSGEGWLCEVEVEQAGHHTRHSVTVTPVDLARWGRGVGEGDVEDLTRRSFAFLLEREPAGSILRTFDLSVIRRYFPEYDRIFKR